MFITFIRVSQVLITR